MYDCIIIGMGPAGMSSALYSNKANLKTLILESDVPGGLLNKIKNIDNLIGYPNINGSDLAFRRVSKTAKRQRRTHLKKTAPTVTTCPNCGEVVAPHRACTKCGYYKGKEAIKVNKEETK